MQAGWLLEGGREGCGRRRSPAPYPEKGKWAGLGRSCDAARGHSLAAHVCCVFILHNKRKREREKREREKKKAWASVVSHPTWVT